MIIVATRQRIVRREHSDGRGQQSVEPHSPEAALFALIVALETGGVPNRPHSGSPATPRRILPSIVRRGGPLSLRRPYPCWEQAARMAGPCLWQCETSS